MLFKFCFLNTNLLIHFFDVVIIMTLNFKIN